MAKTLIWSVALIVSALILASGGINAQRDVVPIDEPDPPAAPTPVPADTSATPVMVENFPTTQTVDIRGFPHIVTVEGTVDVGNFPAVQDVAGTVDVGNLPLDADGNVRVSAAPEGAPAYQLIQLPDLYIPEDPHVYADPINVGGWKKARLIVQFADVVPGPGWTGVELHVGMEFGIDGTFLEMGATAFISQLPDEPIEPQYVEAEVKFPELRLHGFSVGGSGVATDMWLYLTN